MELELEPRVRPLAYKVKAMSRESTSQKAAHVLESDLRTHWSTGTNNKEWILLELDEPCLLSHLRIYNKSVLEWEIAVGLRYKPETFAKVRPRCDAPRREMMYPMNYTPCRYVRISCLRGNPIAIFFIQLIGISVTGLEPEFQPVVNYLLPDIISHKQDAHDIHLQLLQDVTNRLPVFLPQLETDLINFSESAESNVRFLAMLVGPFYPILRIVKERETERASLSCSDPDRNKLASNLSVSSNFEAQPRRSRSPSPLLQPTFCSIAFRLEIVFVLLRKAYKDSSLGNVCRIASRALQKLVGPTASAEDPIPVGGSAVDNDGDGAKAESLQYLNLTDYSSLFGEEFKIPDDCWDASYVNLLDITSIEEAILHVLYACASQSHLCNKLADNSSDFWSVLPLIHALLPALRPSLCSHPDQVDDSFSQWNNPFVRRALSQITSSLSSLALHSLLRASAGYLSSFLPSHAKAACVLIDLCSGPLAPWMHIAIAKVDLAIDLLEDLLGTLQCASQYIARACAALKYIVLALSGHMDDILPKYKEVKHKVLFLVEMLDPFLNPAVSATRNTIAFGDVSTIFLEKQEQNCAIALNIIRSAVQRPAVLISLESEWRRGSVAPSVLLSILGPHLPLPPEIDLCKCSVSKVTEQDSSPALPDFSVQDHVSSKSSCIDESDGKCDSMEALTQMDGYEDASMLFAPLELKNVMLVSKVIEHISPEKDNSGSSYNTNEKCHGQKVSVDQIQNCLMLKAGSSVEYFNMQADYSQLVNLEDCESRASEFQRLAFDLHSQDEITPEGHGAAIDALLLAAECYINPFFLLSFRSSPKHLVQAKTYDMISKIHQKNEIIELAKDFQKNIKDLGTVSHLERKRDKIVLEILLRAAEMSRRYQDNASEECPYVIESTGGTQISETDMQAADAVTLVRQNQALLCHFLTQRLLREQQTLHEVLLQSLLFYLHSATELYCPPEDIIDIIIQSAGNLNTTLTSLYHQLKESNGKLDLEILYGIQRHWMLLQRLVTASSGSDSESESKNVMHGFQYGSLIPVSAWILRIPTLSVYSSPLVRFLGWMALSQYAKQYLKEKLFLSFDLSHLTSLLSIFKDELAIVDNIVNQKAELPQFELLEAKHHHKGTSHYDHPNYKDSFSVEHPDLQKFFPDMKLQFGIFGEIILEAVRLQLKSLPSIAVSDALCWFSEFCLSPFPKKEKEKVSVANPLNHLRGHAGKNAKAIVLCILEAIVCEHMEAMVPEMPRIAQVLVSLCKASYCDVAFLDSVLHVLKPLISYALRKFSVGENLLIDDSFHDYEALCFEELFNNIKCKKESDDSSIENTCHGPLVIFTLAALFPDLSLLRKQEIVQSLSLWADFTSEPTSSYFDYLSAFQSIIDSFIQLLIHSLEAFGVEITQFKSQLNVKTMFIVEENLRDPSTMLDNFQQSSLLSTTTEVSHGACDGSNSSSERASHLYPKDAEDISKAFNELFSKLYPAIELCWKLHFQLALKLTVASAKCCMLLRRLVSIGHLVADIGDKGSDDFPTDAAVTGSRHWEAAFEELSTTILEIQQNHCWQVASAMLDYLLGLPEVFSLDCVMSNLCVTLKNFCCHAPRISWRLQTDKWLSSFCSRAFGLFTGDGTSLGDLFCIMLGHSEPEQRCIALQHLGKLVGLDINDRIMKSSYMLRQDSFSSDNVLSTSVATVSNLVSITWDKVAALALSDPLLLIRANSMVLLSGYVPFADRTRLQSFLVTADSILPGIQTHAHPMQDPLVHQALYVLACACLYSPNEDISLIPESVWRSLDNMITSKSVLGVLEKKICQALSELRAEADDGKEVLKETLSSSSAVKQSDPEFRCIRESILQVLSSLTSAQSFFDFFSKKIDQEAQELEEAEIEIDLIQKDKALLDSSERQQEAPPVPIVSYHSDCNNRLSKLKNEIRDLERYKLREEIAARRQKKLLASRTRQKYLEEADLREVELLKELDRERSGEVEREIERQRLLEVERSKTRELRYNLDVERERQTQRELQRELEQAESGVQTARREFSSNPSGRPRERYRDRENGRSSHEGSMRPSSRDREGGSHPATSSSNMAPVAPAILLSGSRPFTAQPPTILQSRDRSDERVSGYDDNFDGSRDSGDATSVGEPDTGSAFDGLTGGYGSVPRQGSRGSRSRQQIIERREREGARGGKWERKHS